MTYYVASQMGQPEGPYTVEELMRRGITPDTLVYNQQLGAWTKAGQVPEIANYMNGSSAYHQGGTAYSPQPEVNSVYPPVAPKSWLAESILVTLLCCLPFGIVGIIKASSVDSLYRAGDYEGAVRASESAGKWTKIGFFCGIAYVIICIVFVLVSGFENFRYL